MPPAGSGIPTRDTFEVPPDRAWVPMEHSEGVYFVESARERVGPCPLEDARREASRLNEYELVIALAEAIRAGERGSDLDRLAGEERFAGAADPMLAAALVVLHERSESDEAVEITEELQGVQIGRFLALVGTSHVRVDEYDTPDAAGLHFELLCEGAA